MTTPADRTIAALRTGHDDLAARVLTMTEEDLASRSGASEWTVAQVLSHLGSGAEISSATLVRALDGGPEPAANANQQVWDRWNAMRPAEQAESFLRTNAALVETYEGMDADTRSSVQIDLGFLPAPVDVATAAGFRLNEFALHAWDVKVGTDPTERLAQDAVEQLIDLAPGMIGWIAKPDVLDERPVTVAVELTDLGRRLGLELGDSASITDAPAEPDATLTLRSETWLRLLFGRLGPDHTPGDATVTGKITLEELRQVFPGF